MSVVGGRFARCTRCRAFCKAIAAIPAKPVSSASGLSASSNGPNATASAKKVASRTTSAPSMMRSAGIPRRRNTPPARRATAITAMNSGRARTLLRMPWLPSTSAAPSVTKLPVTCATNRPLRPRKPMVSTKPPLKESNEATARRPRGGGIETVSFSVHSGASGNASPFGEEESPNGGRYGAVFCLLFLDRAAGAPRQGIFRVQRSGVGRKRFRQYPVVWRNRPEAPAEVVDLAGPRGVPLNDAEVCGLRGTENKERPHGAQQKETETLHCTLLALCFCNL